MATEEDFAQYLSSVVNHTAVGHGLALGHQTGILNILFTSSEPLSIQEIAQQGNLKERYVKEWLALMVVGKVIDYDKSTMKYVIGEEKKCVITNKGANNSLHWLGKLLTFTKTESKVAECFKKDGPKGVPMSDYVGFQFHHHSHEHDTMSKELLSKLIGKFPEVQNVLETGGSILEAGCGNGILSRRIAETFPKSTVHGVDISEEAIQIARNVAAEQGISNVTYDVQDLSKLPTKMSDKYDFVCSHFVIHDVPRASVALKEICRVLKPGAVYLMVDFNMHSDAADNMELATAPLVYAASLYFAMPVSLAEEGGEGLGPAWGIELQQQYLKDTGFVNVHLPIEPEGRQAYVAGMKPL